VKIDFLSREVTVKLVYYGPALSGKTTNLQALHDASRDGAAGQLLTLETRDDRTLFFDLLPLSFKGTRDVSVRLKVFTVPGQSIHVSTRKLVLQGVDGVVFVADSNADETKHNAASFLDLKENLSTHGIALKELPVVIQFNKQDLPNAISRDELAKLASKGKELVFPAIATEGKGVVETFMALLDVTWRRLEHTHGLSSKLGIHGAELLQEVGAQLGCADVRGAIAQGLGPAPSKEAS
jgi:signal recognition particle receptor subunit beta